MHQARITRVAAGPIAAAAFAVVVSVSVPTASAEPKPGWTLYSGLASTQSFLVDLDGVNIKTWDHSFPPGVSFYLRNEGSILRPANDFSLPGPSGGGVGGRPQKFAWDGTFEWDYVIASPSLRQHHDLAFLPNGNILAIVWDSITAAEAIALGRDLLWCGADIAAPYGVFDLADLQLFVSGFVAGDPIADMNSDGVFDLADIQQFVAAFVNECD